MSEKTYTSKLKNPLWQKKRLEVLEYASWRCQICGSKEKELHIHHSFYEKDKEPWEYDKSMMIAICDNCHEKHHKNKKNEKQSEEFDEKISSIQEILSNCVVELYLLNNNNSKNGVCGYLINDLTKMTDGFFNMNNYLKLVIEKSWVNK